MPQSIVMKTRGILAERKATEAQQKMYHHKESRKKNTNEWWWYTHPQKKKKNLLKVSEYIDILYSKEYPPPKRFLSLIKDRRLHKEKKIEHIENQQTSIEV